MRPWEPSAETWAAGEEGRLLEEVASGLSFEG